MRKNIGFPPIVVALMVCVLIAACDNSAAAPQPAATIQNTPPSAIIQSTSPTPAQNGSRVQDRASLVAALQKAGASVNINDQIDQPFLSVPGKTITVNGQAMQTFEYADAAALAADAGKIGPDGAIPTMMITWIAQPHFYKAGRLLVIYPGTDAKTLDQLKAALGDPFAVGAPVVSPPPHL